jgi:serine/threonine-protein kinase RsbW
MPDEVRLVMPADPEFLRLARVTAIGLASRLSFTLDEIDDLRIAIDELVFALIGTRGRSGTVRLRYSLLVEGLQVVGLGHFDDDATAPGLSEFSELILDAVADEHALFVDGASHGFRLLKRRREG